MIKSILTLILCAWSSCAWAFPPWFLATSTSGGVAAVEWVETFDATGYDKSGWTETGSPSEDCTTSPCPLVGTQSLSISYGSYSVFSPISISGTFKTDFLVRFTSLTSAADSLFFILSNSANTEVAYIVVRAADTIRAYHGSANNTSSATLSAGNTYHLWVEYIAGSGSDGVLSVYHTEYTGSETRPGTRTCYVTTGTSTTDVNKIKVANLGSDNGGNNVFDNLRIEGI